MITRSPKPAKPLSALPARRAPTPLRSGTSVATATTSILTSATATGSTATPHEAMVASQLAHINDLVQKNRGFEQTIKKLNEDLSKSSADVLALTAERKSWEGDRDSWTGERQKWMDERKMWAEGCDAMQAFHRIQQYRVACSLHDERVAILKMQEAARLEQLKRLQRDYKITMFQVRESELEEQIDQADQLLDEAVEARARCEKVAEEFEARSTALAEDVKSKTAEIQASHKQREQVEDDLRRLREAHADATATSTATSSKLTRLTTERNALDAQVTSLKRSLELAQDETIQLRTQLANWQDLKKGEDAEAENLRKKKAEFEQEIRDAKRRITELETRAEEADTLESKVQKQREKIDKSKSILQEWQTEVKEQTTAREAAETSLTDANVQIATLEQKIVELQAQLAIASKSRPSSKKSPPDLMQEGESSSTSVLPAQVRDMPSKVPSTSKPSSSGPAGASAKPRSKPRFAKQPSPVPELDSDIEILDSPPFPSAAPEQSTKAKGKQKAVHDNGDVSHNQVGEVKKKKKKNVDEEAEEKEPPKAKTTKRKKRSSTSDDTDEVHPKTKAKPGSNKKRASPGPPKKSKPNSSQVNEISTARDPDPDVAPKKKKRKINLFGGSQPSTFDWNQLTQTGEDLGIPRQLSPMKETDVVPRRLGRASKV